MNLPTAPDDNAIFLKRSATVFRSQRSRKPFPGIMEADLSYFRLWLLDEIPFGCAYCKGSLTLLLWELDHDVPLSRGGHGYPANWRLAHPECNQQKGALTGEEYRRLLDVVATFAPQAAMDFWRRLRNGGKWKQINAARKAKGRQGLRLPPGIILEDNP